MEEATVEKPSTTIDQLAQELPEQMVPCNLIDADFNYRRRMKQDKLLDLRSSIKALGGLMYPVFLRCKPDGRYQLLVGNRRYHAVVAEFGPEALIKAKVLDVNDEQAIALMLSENGARDDPSVIEEAEGAKRMLGACNGNREEAAARLGWDPKKLDKRLALMNASQSVRDAYLDDHIGVAHVELLAAFRREVQDNIIAKLKEGGQWPTVQQLKTMAAKALFSLEVAIFDRTQCNGCQHNTGFQQAMFEASFDGSNCTNGQCYEKKTEATLETRRDKLQETYQVVRIVRVGDNDTVTALKADGPKGVGAAQAQACRGCGDFGACVSAVPDQLGKTFTDVCFNPTCNKEKVEAEKARQAAAAKAAEPASEAPPPAAAGEAGSKADPTPTRVAKAPAAAPATAPSTNSIRPVLKEYREEIWRAIFNRAAKKLPAKTSRALLIGVLLTRPSFVDNHAAVTVINEALGDLGKLGTSNGAFKTLAALLKLDQEQLAIGLQALPAHLTKDTPINEIVGFLKALEIRIEDWWKLNAEFLDVLTKSEIEAVCQEVGLAKAAGKTFDSLKGKPKKEFIDAMLKVEGFNYQGVVPKLMRW